MLQLPSWLLNPKTVFKNVFNILCLISRDSDAFKFYWWNTEKWIVCWYILALLGGKLEVLNLCEFLALLGLELIKINTAIFLIIVKAEPWWSTLWLLMLGVHAQLVCACWMYSKNSRAITKHWAPMWRFPTRWRLKEVHLVFNEKNSLVLT